MNYNFLFFLFLEIPGSVRIWSKNYHERGKKMLEKKRLKKLEILERVFKALELVSLDYSVTLREIRFDSMSHESRMVLGVECEKIGGNTQFCYIIDIDDSMLIITTLFSYRTACLDLFECRSIKFKRKVL